MKKKITITIDVELLERLRAYAEKEERAISNQISKIIKDFLDNLEG